MNDLEIYKILINIELANCIEKIKKTSLTRDVVFLCVGNSKVWYDSFGPMMGSLLQFFGVKNYVYGNIRSNIHKDNIHEYIKIINKFHYNPYIVVFDNAFSNNDEFGIKIMEDGVECAAFSNDPAYVGDLSILCLTPCQFIKENRHYADMLGEIKKLAFYFKELYL